MFHVAKVVISRARKSTVYSQFRRTKLDEIIGRKPSEGKMLPSQKKTKYVIGIFKKARLLKAVLF